jgi:hypothetical protein
LPNQATNPYNTLMSFLAVQGACPIYKAKKIGMAKAAKFAKFAIYFTNSHIWFVSNCNHVADCY